MEPVINTPFKPIQGNSDETLKKTSQRLKEIKALGLNSIELGSNTIVAIEEQDKKIEQSRDTLEEIEDKLDKHERGVNRMEVVEKVDDIFPCIIS